jgi:hypothetical protein
MSRRWWGVVLLVTCVTGCAYPYSRNHKSEPEAYYADRMRCLVYARQSAGQVYGHLFYVMQQQNAMYLPCMQSLGWFVPKPPTTTPADIGGQHRMQ